MKLLYNTIKFSNLLIIFLILTLIFLINLLLSDDLLGLFGAKLNEELIVEFINVGQGDAILVRTPKGRNFLIDGGMNVSYEDAKKSGRELVQLYLKSKNIRYLDGIVITHAHNDHISGLLPVLKTFNIAKVWEAGVNIHSPVYYEFKKLCERRRISKSYIKAGDILDWGDELFVQVLHPEYTKKLFVSDVDLNNMSAVIILKYGLVSIMLAGDIEEKAQIEIARYGSALKSDVIKIPHHGADTSLYEPFLSFVKPKYGIIQVGKHNPFNLPSEKTINTYKKFDTKIYRTDIHGTISLHVIGRNENDYYFRVDHNE